MAPASAFFAGLALTQLAAAEHRGHGYKNPVNFKGPRSAGSVQPVEELLAGSQLPEHFDWRSVNGKSYATMDWNQHIPQYCGACWVHGTLSALNDRIKILRNRAFPDVMLGRQSIMNCVPPMDGEGTPPGCDGGAPVMIHHYMHYTGVPDETCMPYQGKNMECEADNICRNCAADPTRCWAVTNFAKYGVSSYGSVKGEEPMMKEIFARGPIACSFATDGPFMYNYSENVIQHEGVYRPPVKKNASQIDHIMEVAGWGETKSGLKYWVVRNSWGTYWGETGWLKLERGINALMVEEACDWAIPSFEGLDEALAGRVWGDYHLGTQPLEAVVEKAGLEVDSVTPIEAARYVAIEGMPIAPIMEMAATEAKPEEVALDMGAVVCTMFAFVAGVGVAAGTAHSMMK